MKISVRSNHESKGSGRGQNRVSKWNVEINITRAMGHNTTIRIINSA